MVSNVKFDTADLWRKDRDHYIHPWTDFSTFKEEGSVVMADSDGAYVMFGHTAATNPTDAAGVPLYRPGSLLIAYYVTAFSMLLVHYLHDGFFFFRTRYVVDKPKQGT